MYARVTTVRAKPDRISEIAPRIPELKLKLKQLAIAGLVSHQVLWRNDGVCMAIVIYETREAADAATEKFQAILGVIAESLLEPPIVESFDNAEDMLNPSASGFKDAEANDPEQKSAQIVQHPAKLNRE